MLPLSFDTTPLIMHFKLTFYGQPSQTICFCAKILRSNGYVNLKQVCDINIKTCFLHLFAQEMCSSDALPFIGWLSWPFSLSPACPVDGSIRQSLQNVSIPGLSLLVCILFDLFILLSHNCRCLPASSSRCLVLERNSRCLIRSFPLWSWTSLTSSLKVLCTHM